MLGRARAGKVEIDLRAAQFLCLGTVNPAVEGDLSPQLSKTLQVEIDRPRADLASTGGGHLDSAQPGEQRTEKVEGSADRANGLLIGLAVAQVGAVDDERALAPSHLG